MPRYVPQQDIFPYLSFEEALQSEAAARGFDRARWRYVPPFMAPYRYILGVKGEKPVLCLGLNPSTAEPLALDRTLQSVERVARFNGFDGFMMLNLSAQRATGPKDMAKHPDMGLHRENLRAFRSLLRPDSVVWAAFGAVIKTRPYLMDFAADFARACDEMGVKVVTAGPKSREGHPHHPLYLKKDSPFEAFDLAAYCRERGAL